MSRALIKLVCLLLLLAQASFIASRGKVFCVPVATAQVAHEHDSCSCDHQTEAEPAAIVEHVHAGVAQLSLSDDHRPCSDCFHLRTPEPTARPANPPAPEAGPAVEQVNLAAVLLTHAILALDPRLASATAPTHLEPPWTIRAETRALQAVRLLV